MKQETHVMRLVYTATYNFKIRKRLPQAADNCVGVEKSLYLRVRVDKSQL